ncbi:MAG: YkgJ family cysteine cluster protein [Gemmatimonadales bacterium]|nr:YkgJ family cysteine cluster protein [Gemmatimonadales bacterium]
MSRQASKHLRHLPVRHPAPLPVLPCFPCPHASACCSWGTTLTDEEAEAIRAAHGADTCYRTRWGEWRTRVRKGRCVFLKDNACRIHGQPYYPEVCRAFPWTDAETGGPYAYTQTICPEFVAHPEYERMGVEWVRGRES